MICKSSSKKWKVWDIVKFSCWKILLQFLLVNSHLCNQKYICIKYLDFSWIMHENHNAQCILCAFNRFLSLLLFFFFNMYLTIMLHISYYYVHHYWLTRCEAEMKNHSVFGWIMHCYLIFGWLSQMLNNGGIFIKNLVFCLYCLFFQKLCDKILISLYYFKFSNI